MELKYFALSRVEEARVTRTEQCAHAVNGDSDEEGQQVLRHHEHLLHRDDKISLTSLVSSRILRDSRE